MTRIRVSVYEGDPHRSTYRWLVVEEAMDDIERALAAACAAEVHDVNGTSVLITCDEIVCIEDA